MFMCVVVYVVALYVFDVCAVWVASVYVLVCVIVCMFMMCMC